MKHPCQLNFDTQLVPIYREGNDYFVKSIVNN